MTPDKSRRTNKYQSVKKDNPTSPNLKFQVDIIKDIEVRSESLKALIIVSTIQQTEDLLNSLWTFSHHYIAEYMRKENDPPLNKVRNLCTSYYYAALLLELVNEYKEELVTHMNNILDMCNKQQGMIRIIKDGEERLNRYINYKE